MEDKPRTGQPSTSRNEDNLQGVYDVLNSDQRLSNWITADYVELIKWLCTPSSEYLQIEKSVPSWLWSFNHAQNQSRVLVYEDLLQGVQIDLEFGDNAIIGDET